MSAQSGPHWQEVRKVRRVRKTRPATSELPSDQGVTFDVTTVCRRVRLAGSVRVAGAGADPLDRPLAAVRAASDDTHDEVRTPRLVVAADPLDVAPLATLVTEAAGAAGDQIAEAVRDAVRAHGLDLLEEARKAERSGDLARAEEASLGALVLGGGEGDDGGLASFVSQRYGMDVTAVLATLASVLGRRPGVLAHNGPAPLAARADPNHSKEKSDGQEVE